MTILSIASLSTDPCRIYDEILARIKMKWCCNIHIQHMISTTMSTINSSTHNNSIQRYLTVYSRLMSQANILETHIPLWFSNIFLNFWQDKLGLWCSPGPSPEINIACYKTQLILAFATDISSMPLNMQDFIIPQSYYKQNCPIN